MNTALAVPIKDVHKFYGGAIRRTSTYKLIKQGRLNAVKIGRRTFVTTASIRALVEDAPTTPAILTQ